jgi:hypothetical protein
LSAEVASDKFVESLERYIRKWSFCMHSNSHRQTRHECHEIEKHRQFHKKKYPKPSVANVEKIRKA